MIADKLPKLDANTLVIAQAGNVNSGAFDPINEICERTKQAGAWVHVDGAFGLWAAASGSKRCLTAGLEKADSWSVDAHKTLNELLPMESISKDTDLALLSLIYPFNIVDPKTARIIISNIEYKLLKEHGVIRYQGDHYYNVSNKENLNLNRYYKQGSIIGNEAEWTFASIVKRPLDNREDQDIDAFFELCREIIREKHKELARHT
jgi:hypothetical protein